MELQAEFCSQVAADGAVLSEVIIEGERKGHLFYLCAGEDFPNVESVTLILLLNQQGCTGHEGFFRRY